MVGTTILLLLLRLWVTVEVFYYAIAFQHQRWVNNVHNNNNNNHMIWHRQKNWMTTTGGCYHHQQNHVIMMQQKRRENHFELDPWSEDSRRNNNNMVVPTSSSSSSSRRTNGFNNNNNKILSNIEMMEIEKEVRGSTNAKLDMKRVVTAIEEASQPSGDDPDIVANTANQWQLSMAAATTASIATLFVTNNNFFLATVTFCGLLYVGIGDPNEEEGLAGPLTRVLGRTTIKSVEKSKPKIRAVVKAAMTDNNNNDDSQQQTITKLREEINHLKAENASLRLWKEKRIATEMLLDKYTPEELNNLESRLPSSIFNNNKSDYWDDY